MNEATAHRVRRRGGPEGQRRAVDLDLAAGTGTMVAGQDLDDRRLARAVLAHERVHLARLDVQLEAGEGHHPREGLRQPPDAQRGARLRRAPRRQRGQDPTCQSFSICVAKSAGWL